jgi:selenocysteine-specific elongation factor
MYVIGTAGHVDHGKSTLVKALTGIHPDRLKEEIDREMTIDLGFAWLTLPSGDFVGIVDMPGHRDFIENMLAGVGGIDAVLLVIAADEGVMPQTREHLAIIDLLQVKKGIIVLTKTDLVKDPEWMTLVKEDIKNLVKGTVLERAPVISVSSVSGEGIDDLKETLSDLLREGTSRVDLGRPRLPIDRVFTMTGFGTVATGTLLDGELEVGQEVELLPVASKARIRGLQSYKTKHTRIGPGNRVAVNLSGINVDQVKRGEVLSLPGKYVPTNVIYAHVHILKEAMSPAKSNSEIKIFVGSAEVLARMKILGSKEINPGEDGWVKLESIEPMVVVKRDRFILRRPSPAETIGGGEIVEEHPGKVFETHRKSIVENLEVAYKGLPRDILNQALLQKGSLSMDDLQKNTHFSAEDTVKAVNQLFLEGKAQILRGDAKNLSGSSLIIHSDAWTLSSGRISDELKNFHEQNPLKRGMPKEEVRSKLKLDARLFQLIVTKMVSDGKLIEDAAYLHLPEFKIRYTPEQRAAIKDLQTLFDKNPFAPPSIADCIALVGEEVFNVLIDNEVFFRLNQDVAFDPKNLERLRLAVMKYFETHPTLSVAEFRDLVGTSRKYALAVLEYLDERGVTIRKGESRVLVVKRPLTD